MISYHPIKRGSPKIYYKGFRTAPIDDIKRIANGISQFVWSPIVWDGGWRGEMNFYAANWVALDFDDGEMTLDEAINNYFCDRIHIIGTTKSHQKPKKKASACDRFRVVIKLDKTIRDIRTFRHTMHLYTQKLPVDVQCKDGARFFFPCSNIVSISEDAEPDTVRQVPEDFEPHVTVYGQFQRAHRRKQIEGGIPKHIKKFLNRGVIFGGGRNISCYTTARTLFLLSYDRDQIEELLNEAPFDKKNFNGEVLGAIKSAWKKIQLGIERDEYEAARDRQCSTICTPKVSI